MSQNYIIINYLRILIVFTKWKNIQYFESKMEKSLQHRYLNSQDQLIISLNEQIEAMIPLKDSYASLQRYHIRLLHDFESLLAEQDHTSMAYSDKIQDLFAINQELDIKKNQYIDELRNLENQKAKLILDRKNMMSCCETLSSKFNLQNQQNLILQERTRQIIDNIKKTQQNINLYRKIITEVETDIRMKASENSQIENQILRRIESNRKATQRIQSTQLQIKSCTAKNDRTVGQIRALDKTQDQIQLKIREQLKKIKQLNEKILCRKQDIAHLNHQKQYYARLIESQMIIKQDLDISETKLNGLLDRRLKQCERVAKQNCQIQQKIKIQQQTCQKSIKYKDALLAHLTELARANAILLETMKKSCKEDEKAHQVLHKKLDGLDTALIRSSQTDNTQIYKKSLILREKTNQLLNTKKADKSGSTWIKQLDIQNL